VIAIASEFHDVELSHMQLDSAAMKLFRDPKQVSSLQAMQQNFNYIFV